MTARPTLAAYGEALQQPNSRAGQHPLFWAECVPVAARARQVLMKQALDLRRWQPPVSTRKRA